MLQPGMVVNGRYEITALIGKGGMSQVFRARDRVSNADLAIKEALQNGEKDNQPAELGLSVEGNLLKRLSNPHLPKIYEVIEDRDNIMIVMDFVEGQSLDKVLMQVGAVSPEKVIEWGIQICDVFHYLHTQNPPIIYRDMKPANVILRPDGNIMMIDFGTARRWKVDVNRTSDTMLIGTEGFAAPEQFGGRGQSDARTDIFCLGATMFNLVTNHSPYLKPFGITPLGNWDPALKDCPLDLIIQKCTANDPYERFQTADELKQALINAQNTPGKTGFFGLIKGNTRRNKGWQEPVMKVSKGESRRLTRRSGELGQVGRTAEAMPTAPKTAGWQQPVNQVPPQLIPVQKRPPAQRTPAANAMPPQGNYSLQRGMAQQPPSQQAEDAFLWKIFMIVGLIAGFVLLVLAIVLFTAEDGLAAGIILAVLAIAVAVFGVISALQYVKRM